MERLAVFLVIIIAASFLTCSSSNAHPWEEEGEDLETIHVSGKVLCQDCTEAWNQWVNGSRPINGSKVSITCMDERRRVNYYGSDLTDNIGHFEIIIKKYIYGKQLKPNNCFLRLVSSPDPVCNIPTNFAGGKTGVMLRRPSMVYRDIIKYVLGPFYYTTPMCDEPDTSGENENNGEDTEDGKDSKY